MALKLEHGFYPPSFDEHGFYPPSFDEHGFEGVFNIHCFDFLGLDFAINTSEIEEQNNSNLEIQVL